MQSVAIVTGSTSGIGEAIAVAPRRGFRSDSQLGSLSGGWIQVGGRTGRSLRKG